MYMANVYGKVLDAWYIVYSTFKLNQAAQTHSVYGKCVW